MLCANNISSAPILNRVFLYIHHAKVIKYRKVYFRTIERIKINIYKSTCTATPIPKKFIGLILTVPTLMHNISDHKRKTIKSINLTCFSKCYLWNWEVKKRKEKNPHFIYPFVVEKLDWLIKMHFIGKSITIIIIHEFIINWRVQFIGSWVEGSGSTVIFTDLSLDVRQFGSEIFTPLLLNLVLWWLWTIHKKGIVIWILYTQISLLRMWIITLPSWSPSACYSHSRHPEIRLHILVD